MGASGTSAAIAVALFCGCGSVDSTVAPDGASSADPDATPDARLRLAQCDNGIDDDGDGAIDSDDIHCTSGHDHDEASFGLGITDVMLRPLLDCHFDGDFGSGNDGCQVHLCCSLGAVDQTECDQLGDQIGFNPDSYDPATDCQVSPQCLETCPQLVPPDCDCFGCCNLCNDTGCFDVMADENLSPTCDLDTLGDPAACQPCTPITECQSPCGDTAECAASSDCGDRQWCARGCCVKVAD